MSLGRRLRNEYSFTQEQLTDFISVCTKSVGRVCKPGKYRIYRDDRDPSIIVLEDFTVGFRDGKQYIKI